MGKKVLIIYAPYGSGHKSIADKINNYFEENSDLEIKVLDVAKYSNILGKASIKMFDIVTKHSFHKTFSFIYDIADKVIFKKNSDVLAVYKRVDDKLKPYKILV